MTENELKIRKQWLAVFILNLVQTTVWQFLMFFYNPMLGEMPSSFGLIGGVLSTSVFGYAIYHCVYKKPGIKLLTVFLVLSFAGLFVTPVLLIMGKMNPPFYIPFYVGLQVLSYLIAICWTVVCWRIRKVNQKLISSLTLSNTSRS